jgi:hypothetical protein
VGGAGRPGREVQGHEGKPQLRRALATIFTASSVNPGENLFFGLGKFSPFRQSVLMGGLSGSFGAPQSDGQGACQRLLMAK